MKKIYLMIITAVIFCSNCKAQFPIIDIEKYSFRNSIENAYYKDINNFLDPFEGTFGYTKKTITF